MPALHNYRPTRSGALPSDRSPVSDQTIPKPAILRRKIRITPRKPNGQNYLTTQTSWPRHSPILRHLRHTCPARPARNGLESIASLQSSPTQKPGPRLPESRNTPRADPAGCSPASRLRNS
jgi:hypothetical protein